MIKASKTRSRAEFKCESLAPVFGRREILLGLAAAVSLAPAAMGGEARTRIADLADDIGNATPKAISMTGQSVNLRGYFAPAMRAGVLIDLFERPAAPCQMCGVFHDAGTSIAVVGDSLPKNLSMLRAIDVAGTIAVSETGKAQIIARAVATV